MERPEISVVVPFYNEIDSVAALYTRLLSVLGSTGKPFEIIFVDDGSTDKTYEEIKKLEDVRAIRLRRNSGQTAAMGVGIKEARGDIIITLDGDLENQPEDIPMLLHELEKGNDIVTGWRRERWQKQFLTRRIPSKIANGLISFVTGAKLHDHGCNFRVYRKKILEGIVFSGDMHRMIAAYALREGGKITELPIRFEARKFGVSKYGLSRTFKVLLDILAFHFFYKYARRPIHFFGALGFMSFFVGALTSFFALYLKIFTDTNFNR
ncbi:MAG: glycosyltransferase family 2 protein, partial [bacterium]|nr:glycosyltransferase family 2 protein [bacterium]